MHHSTATAARSPRRPGRRRRPASRPQPLAWFGDDGMPGPATMATIVNAIYGGFFTTTASRRLAAEAETAWPPLRAHLTAGRNLLDRIVRHLLAAGIRQFLDIGGGIAQFGATHEILADAADHADGQDPAVAQAARVVYVDIDPITTELNTAILRTVARPAAAVCGDLQYPQTFLNHDTVNDLLDFGEPVGVLLLGVLHHLPPRPGPRSALHRLTEALSPGSYLAISHLTTDPDPHGAATQQHALRLLHATPTPLYPRHPAHIAALLHDPQLPALELLEPGLVAAHAWRPDGEDDPREAAPHLLTAVARLIPQTPPHRGGSAATPRPADRHTPPQPAAPPQEPLSRNHTSTTQTVQPTAAVAGTVAR